MATDAFPTPSNATRRPRPRGCSLRALVVILLAMGVQAAAPPPFKAVVASLMELFHATVVPCEVVVPHEAVCFTVHPGQVALLAEAFERFVEEHGGGLTRSAWTSANGAHRVVLTLCDPSWGALELWLIERPDRRVDGMLEYLPKRRS